MRKYIKKFNKVSIVTVLTIALVLGFTPPIPVHAATSPTLVGSANYSVLGSTPAVTNTGLTTTVGEVGISPAASITGFPPGIAGGSNITHLHLNDASAIAAHADNLSAYGDLNQTCGDGTAGGNGGDGLGPVGGINWAGATIDLVGKTLVPGVYCASVFQLSGTLTLDDTGAPGGVWIFKAAAAAAALTTTTGTVVFKTSVASACNVWWRVASSATLGTGTNFKGNILASTSIVMDTGATLVGRAFAYTGTVTLDTNTITGCAAPAATLNVIKHVVTDNGGVATASDWVLTVASSDGGSGTGFADGTESGTIYTLETGRLYGVTEVGPSGYTPSLSDECTITSAVVAGTNYTCTITNDDIAPTLILKKIVFGGVEYAPDWTLTATGPTGFTGLGPTLNNGASFDIGTYNLSEAGPSGYEASDWVCVGGTQVDGDTVTLALDEDAICTITNSRQSSSSGSIARVVAPIFQPTITILSTPVVVAPVVPTVIPKLPKTGFPPQEKSAMLPIVLLSGLSLVSIFLYFAQKKQTT